MAEPIEVKPFQMFDKGNRGPLDFRPIPVTEDVAPEIEPDPKDSSAPEPVISSSSELTIEPNPGPTVSAAKDSGKLKANGNGSLTSSSQI